MAFSWEIGNQEEITQNQDEETPPKNPLYGKFDEMVDAALAPQPGYTTRHMGVCTGESAGWD